MGATRGSCTICLSVQLLLGRAPHPAYSTGVAATSPSLLCALVLFNHLHLAARRKGLRCISAVLGCGLHWFALYFLLALLSRSIIMYLVIDNYAAHRRMTSEIHMYLMCCCCLPQGGGDGNSNIPVYSRMRQRDEASLARGHLCLYEVCMT